MIVTQNQAFKMWCPLSRDDGSNRPRLDHNCKGSDCMMWREVDAGGPVGNFDTKATGYCGVAGTPNAVARYDDLMKTFAKLANPGGIGTSWVT